MFALTGQVALIAAAALALAQAVFGVRGVAGAVFADRFARLQFAAVGVAYLALTTAFIVSDFSVGLVAQHSHTAKPLVYKISGVWANHEGSMLLWVLILAIFGALAAVRSRGLPDGLRARALGVQGALGLGFILFLLLTSNPFTTLAEPPANGLGLNPILQDPGLAIHPPLLYIGYVGFSVAFSFAVAALLEGRVDAQWARWLRPWVLAAWSFLTLGITIGSVWAYYELGWGGWWVWDPVENVSFMPWLAGTALLHSVLTLRQRHQFAHWTVLLAIATFALSLVGTFVVRSGILVSVHAFAVDPERGVVLLALLLAYTGAALTLYAVRSRTLMEDASLSLVSRDTGLVINNLLLVVSTAVVFLGTFYPVFIDALSGDKISVGAPYFDIVFAPLMLLLIAVMAIAPLLKWREDSLSRLRKPLTLMAVAALAMGALVAIFGRSVFGALGVTVAVWLIAGTVVALHRRTGGRVERIRRQPAATWAFVFGHIGVGIFTLGVTAMGMGAEENLGRVSPGDSLEAAGYTFTLGDLRERRADNFIARYSDVAVTRGGSPVTTLRTEQRFYPVRQMITSEAGFRPSLGPTLFAAIGEGGGPTEQDEVLMRVYYQPGVVWIWIGALLMALGGFVGLVDSRVRLPQTRPVEAAAMPEPAE